MEDAHCTFMDRLSLKEMMMMTSDDQTMMRMMMMMTMMMMMMIMTMIMMMMKKANLKFCNVNIYDITTLDVQFINPNVDLGSGKVIMN